LISLIELTLIYEDQIESDWDRMWFSFETMFPEIDINKYTQSELLKIILPRFAKLNVFFDISMARSFYKLPLKELQTAADELVRSGEFVNYDNGYMLKSDFDFLNSGKSDNLKQEKSAYVMHRNDFLVKSNENSSHQHPRLLKSLFKHPDYGILQYILIDGVFHGALCGRFTFGPAELEDVVLDLPEDEKIARKSEILGAIYEMHNREASPLKRYCGIEE